MTTKKGCGSCGSAKIQNVSIAFKDETAPKIKRITITSDKNSDTPALYFKEGQTIYVKVKFSEYVRLADNSAVKKHQTGVVAWTEKYGRCGNCVCESGYFER